MPITNIPAVSSSGVPVGVIKPYAGAAAPNGFLLCYGQAVSRQTYASLFAIIGTTFGSGDGSTTFNLPDLRGRAPVGKDNMGGSAANRITSGGSGIVGTTLGATGGAETHTLTTAQLAQHNHGVTDPGHVHAAAGEPSARAAGANTGWGIAAGATNALAGVQSGATNISIQNNGSGQAHNNTQPSIVLNYIIAYQ